MYKDGFSFGGHSASVFLCDFHQEQGWTRWVRDRKHGLEDDEGKALLSLLWDCAWASASANEDLPVNTNYKKVEEKLQASAVFKRHQEVHSWLYLTWLSIPEVWNYTVYYI